MDTDSAELSSAMAVVAELADRLDRVAERRGADPDDPTVTRLHEISRSLVTVQRRIRSLMRDMN